MQWQLQRNRVVLRNICALARAPHKAGVRKDAFFAPVWASSGREGVDGPVSRYDFLASSDLTAG
ncbi:hypothetical protein [Ruegeria lacuscaerulensis]|uniref:hypothetical protein n=1 Tax=Ruegeria lacuscaerulensis TaxID=55218 RepID=UPI00147A824D|nr:hypothetical protein [Ruegeria lacuscaerulensis]